MKRAQNRGLAPTLQSIICFKFHEVPILAALVWRLSLDDEGSDVDKFRHDIGPYCLLISNTARLYRLSIDPLGRNESCCVRIREFY
jgi:hypothetical protein